MFGLLDMIERGFDDIEHRIANMDKEHTKYVRATVTRLNYLLSGETDTKGLVIRLLNRMAQGDDYEEVLRSTGSRMNLSLLEMISEKSLYKRRRGRQDFISQMAPEEAAEDLERSDVLRLNRMQARYSRRQIEEFIEAHMMELILAYDMSTRKDSRYMVLEEDAAMVENNGYRYPGLRFVRRR